MFHGSSIDSGGRQESGTGENRGGHAKFIKDRFRRSQIKVGVEESLDRADVLPCTLENVGGNLVVLDGLGNDIFSKVMQLFIREIQKSLAGENVNSHGSQKEFLFFLDVQFFIPLRFEKKLILYCLLLWFFYKFRN